MTTLPNKKVSVILPNYNYSHYIRSRINDAIFQKYNIYEIIILDDASTDNSNQIIDSEVARIKKEYSGIKIQVLRNHKNSGSVFSQWQKGIKIASGEYIWIAELDDSCSDNFLKTVLAPIERDKNIILSYTNSKLIGDVSLRDNVRQKLEPFRKRHLSIAYVVDGKVELNRNLAVYNSIPNISACVFKNIPEVDKILNEAKKYKLAGDWYFYTKLAELGKIAYLPKKLNHHRLSKNSVTSRTKLEDRFLEIKKIHQELYKKSYILSSTKNRMEKIEENLRKSWHIS